MARDIVIPYCTPLLSKKEITGKETVQNQITAKCVKSLFL